MTSSRLSIPRALTLWTVYAVVFAVAGGLGAGIPALLVELVAGETYDDTLYAIMFGVTGFIGYQLAQRVAGP
ncbi:MAG: hypothetical protein AAGI91_10340 [Bacteroidota bacterium]